MHCMNKTIAITGATGFIGKHLCAYLRTKNYTVIELVRHPANDAQRFFDLAQPVDERVCDGVDVLVHCAFVKDDLHFNYEGTKALLRVARQGGVQQCIFFSSVSAHENAVSLYGKSKLQIEALFTGNDDVVLKCGLVMGDGGLFGQLLNFALKKKMVPLVDGGRQPLQVIALEAVMESVLQAIEKKLHGSFVLVNEERLSYRQFFARIEKVFQTKFRYISIPVWMLKPAIGLASFFKIKLPVSKENLRGLQSMAFAEGKKIMLPSGSQNEKAEDILLKLKQQ
jgi:nucleoside-diphosphate-sugar epimerase